MAFLSVLVSDTNIWVDLENGGILVEVFKLPYQFIIPDLAITELIRPSWETLIVLGVDVHELIADQVLELVQLQQQYRALSSIDLAAFLLAKSLCATLLTGESQLNKLANAYRLSVHGVLWLLDELVKFQILKPGQAAIALRRMLVQGARLPAEESSKRLAIWSE
jgi:hypothetical protein